MATNDVPGAYADTNDILRMGCWAEHDDGSLIFVESTEGSNVVYSIFDVARDPPVEYRSAMPQASFEKTFSFRAGSKEKWTWHDKTPFPWDRVMSNFPEGERDVTADDTISAAARVAESLRLRAQEVSRDRGPRSEERRDTAAGLFTRIVRAIERELRD